MTTLTAIDLTACELRDPLGIDDPAPRLGWALEGGGRDAVQGAWQVQVGTAPGLTDAWDSGRVAGDRQLGIPYAGAPLAPCTRYHWRVRVWSGDGTPGPWSAPAWFETAFLGDRTMPGAWIGLRPHGDDERHPLAAASWVRPERDGGGAAAVWHLAFDLPEAAVERAELHAWAEGPANPFASPMCDNLSVNGTRPDSGQHLPRPSLAAWDIAPWLRPGANRVALRLGRTADGLGIALVEVRLADGTCLRLATGSAPWTVASALGTEADPAWDRAEDAGRSPCAVVAPFGAGPWPADDPRNRCDALRPALVLRRTVVLDRAPASARIHATACGVYGLRLNGHPVGDRVLAPGWTDYRTRVHYQTEDVTGLLHPGENLLEAVVGDGWWCGHLALPFGTAFYGHDKALRLGLTVTDDLGTRTVAATGDDGWLAGTGPVRHADLLDGMHVDATREAGDWRAPAVLPGPAGRLQAQPDRPVRRLMELPVRELTRPVDGCTVLDFGQNLVGWVRLRLRAPRGTVVEVRHAEVLDREGRAWTDNLRSAMAVDRFVCSGGDDVFEPDLTVHGFRYAAVSGLPAGLAPEQAVAVVVGSDTPDAGSFACDLPLVNRLQANIRWGQRGNFLSIPTDCPQRDERMGWTADTQVFARTAVHNADCAAFYRKYVQDLLDAQHPGGSFPDYAPSDVLMEKGRFGWADAGVVMPWTLWRCYGDTDIVGRSWAGMRRYLDQRDATTTGDLNDDWSYGDWVAPAPQVPNRVLNPLHHAWMHRLMAEMAAGTGREADAAHHRARQAAIGTAWRRAHLGADGRLAGDGDGQSAYACAVAAGVLTPIEAAPHLLRTVERHGWHLHTGFLGTACLLPALSRAGCDEAAWRILLQEDCPGWLATVRRGATTMWERWDGYDPAEGPRNIGGMNSYNHYAFGAVGEWLYASVAGLDRAEDDVGFQRLRFRPVPGGGCRRAWASYRSGRGTATSSWWIADERLHLAVQVPPNCTGEVLLPDGGRPEAVRHDGARPQGRADGRSRFAVGAGTWRFSAPA